MKQDPYEALLARARQARDERPETVPFGFSTRVAANRPRRAPADPLAPWAALLPRSLGLALAACLLALAFCHEGLSLREDEALVVLTDSGLLLNGGY